MRLQLLPSQGTLLLAGVPFLCHSCPYVFNVISFVGALSSLSYLWLMSLSAVNQGCARIFSLFLSLASAFVSQLDSLLSSFLCPIIFFWLQLVSAVSQGCVCTFLCSLSSASTFVSQLDCHLSHFLCRLIFLYQRLLLDGLLLDFDIQGQVH